MNDQIEQQQEGFVAVFDAANETTANIVKATLEDEGIPAVVRPMHTSWFDGMFVPAEGRWGEVLVPEGHEERAKAVLAQYGQVENADE